MFGLTKREQRWKAEQAALVALAPVLAAVARGANASSLSTETREAKHGAMRERAEKAEAELAESRETIKRLNRRVQIAEAGVAEKVKASAPGSLGRALANAAASKAEAELAAVKARLFHGIVLEVDDLACGHAGLPSEWRGKRVFLMVEE